MALDTHTFRAVGFPLRLHAGTNALGQLETEVKRQKAKRAFVICGKTVGNKTDLLGRIERELGPLYAGAFDGMDKDSSWPAVEAGVAAARAAGADLLIALGGGSVIVGTRVVAILLGEDGDPFDLMTQYPEGKPAYSPRLMAPKPPIINVPTTPTTAMNRAGSGLKNENLDHRMEYYDPKTRPVALFWDADALLTAPVELIRSTTSTMFSSTLRALGAELSPLVEADLSHAFALQRRSLPRVMEEPGNAALRIELCCAAHLINRAADDDQGRRRARDVTNANAYALSTALHIRYDHVWQGESTTSVIPTATRLVPPEDLSAASRIADAIGVWKDGMDAKSAAEATADALDDIYNRVGMPTRLSQLDIPKEELPLLANDTLKNFNANPGDRPDDYTDRMLALLEAAW
ncbi:MAG: iron-containing alcohol dehydrogenase [Rhodospirillaceae bacterium]|jgi:alcohol dehydrogenase class IV|nr:iron-containing alcohol dehydrogenase [Rhodospirillaceae bacterium]MBT5663842.1 iron-containing alcohol dehydrogenase [Rhodospirillaceae bacterium]MBT5812588.1 iron-containing alcohol dehydrogenase [Rhodospirillaceae bacterium]